MHHQLRSLLVLSVVCMCILHMSCKGDIQINFYAIHISIHCSYRLMTIYLAMYIIHEVTVMNLMIDLEERKVIDLTWLWDTTYVEQVYNNYSHGNTAGTREWHTIPVPASYYPPPPKNRMQLYSYTVISACLYKKIALSVRSNYCTFTDQAYINYTAFCMRIV